MNLYQGTIKTKGITLKEIRKAEGCEFNIARKIKKYMEAFDGIMGNFIDDPLGEEYSLIGWPDHEDEKVKDAIFLMESEPREIFEEKWASGEWEPSGAIIFPKEHVENVKIMGG